MFNEFRGSVFLSKKRRRSGSAIPAYRKGVSQVRSSRQHALAAKLDETPLEEAIDSNSVFYVSVIAGGGELVDLNKSLKQAVRDACHTVFVEDIYAPGFHWVEFTSAVGTKA